MHPTKFSAAEDVNLQNYYATKSTKKHNMHANLEICSSAMPAWSQGSCWPATSALRSLAQHVVSFPTNNQTFRRLFLCLRAGTKYTFGGGCIKESRINADVVIVQSCYYLAGIPLFAGKETDSSVRRSSLKNSETQHVTATDSSYGTGKAMQVQRHFTCTII